MEIGGISNSDLRKGHIPKPFKRYTLEIQEFALTFNGYDHCGSFDACATLGNKSAEAYRTSGRLPAGLSELRSCLFFEQRRWRHLQEDPVEADLEYIQALVESIRQKVVAGQTIPTRP